MVVAFLDLIVLLKDILGMTTKKMTLYLSYQGELFVLFSKKALNFRRLLDYAILKGSEN